MTVRSRLALTLVLVPLVCLVSGLEAHAGRGMWTTAGPEGGVILSIAVEPGTSGSGAVYSGTAVSGVFKSSSSGNFWTPIGPDSQGDIHALAIDPRTPTTLYAATSLGRVLKSTDGGASWARVYAAQSQSAILALTIDPQTPTTLYAVSLVSLEENADGPVFKSTDGGATWRARSVA